MRNPISKRTQSIPPSGIRRFFNAASQMSDVISLGVGEPDFDTPWHVRDEAVYAIQKGRTFYSPNSGLPALRQGIASFYERKYGLAYDSDNEILVTVGASEGIDVALRVLVDEGDEVVYPEPCYVSYSPCVVLAGGVPVPISLSETDQFKLTPEKLKAAITDKTKIVLLSFPNNPTGAIMTREELAAIAELIIEHDLFVISDEIYSELTYGKPHVSIASLPGMRERTVVLNGFSKAFAMTGWRLGYALGPEYIIDEMIKIHQYVVISAPTIGQYAAIDAINNSDEDVAQMRRSYNERRRYLLHSLAELNIPCFDAQGAFYLFPNISQFGLSSEDFALRLLEEERLAVVPGSSFGACGEGYIRISYAYSLSELKEALLRLARFVTRLRTEQAVVVAPPS